jgi:dGTPase
MNEVCDQGLRLHHSQRLDRERRELEKFLFDAVYRHPRLIPVRQAAAERLKTLFDAILTHPNLLPLRFRQRGQRVRIQRVVGEYLAGMTDAFCDAQFDAVGAGQGPLADW